MKDSEHYSDYLLIEAEVPEGSTNFKFRMAIGEIRKQYPEKEWEITRMAEVPNCNTKVAIEIKRIRKKKDDKS